MPLYEYSCRKCHEMRAILRPINRRGSPVRCRCGSWMARFVSIPTVAVWNAERRFPNLSQHGDGTMSFQSRLAYENRLKELGLAESRIDGVVKRPHGNKVVKTYKNNARPALEDEDHG